MATHFNILAWENPWTEEPGGLHSDATERLTTAQHAYMEPVHRSLPKKKKGPHLLYKLYSPK